MWPLGWHGLGKTFAVVADTVGVNQERRRDCWDLEWSVGLVGSRTKGRSNGSKKPRRLRCVEAAHDVPLVDVGVVVMDDGTMTWLCWVTLGRKGFDHGVVTHVITLWGVRPLFRQRSLTASQNGSIFFNNNNNNNNAGHNGHANRCYTTTTTNTPYKKQQHHWRCGAFDSHLRGWFESTSTAARRTRRAHRTHRTPYLRPHRLCGSRNGKGHYSY